MAKKKKSAPEVVQAYPSSPMGKGPEMIHGVEKYQAEDALRDLERAHTHKQNPKIMKAVKHLAKQKKSLYASLGADDDADDRPNNLKELRQKIRGKAPKNDG